MNRTEPSQNRKLQPPGCRLQKSSAPAPLKFGTSTHLWSGDGPVWPRTMTLAVSHERTAHFGLGHTWERGTTPTQVASATLRDRSPAISVVLDPSVMSRRPLRLLR